MKGVQFNAPPNHLLESAMRVVEEQVKQLPPEKNNAVVMVATDSGFNMATVHRAGDHVKVVTWVAKDWGSQITGGGYVEVAW